MQKRNAYFPIQSPQKRNLTGIAGVCTKRLLSAEKTPVGWLGAGNALELGLGALERGQQELAHLVGGLVDVVAHPGAPLLLGNDVEVQAGVKVSKRTN